MSLAIANATQADIPDILRLNLEVQSLHASLAPQNFLQDCDEQELFEFWRAQLNTPRHKVRLAKMGGGIVGYLWFELQERPKTPFNPPRTRLYIHHIGVAASVRRSGVGEALIAQLHAEARALGVSDLLLDTWAANSSARAFFQKAGFKDLNIVMAKHLGRPGADEVV
jgi:ribosomal protein S18 acetylase RimI-like enzyme